MDQPCPQSSDRIHTIDQSSWQRRLIELGPTRAEFLPKFLEMRESVPGDAGKLVTSEIRCTTYLYHEQQMDVHEALSLEER